MTYRMRVSVTKKIVVPYAGTGVLPKILDWSIRMEATSFTVLSATVEIELVSLEEMDFDLPLIATEAPA